MIECYLTLPTDPGTSCDVVRTKCPQTAHRRFPVSFLSPTIVYTVACVSAYECYLHSVRAVPVIRKILACIELVCISLVSIIVTLQVNLLTRETTLGIFSEGIIAIETQMQYMPTLLVD
ncbi:hypothetical protein F5Y14DRAFT_435848 [Nemania sp. NC0429]|nr:hypothetical protein F5Y14DRAFT_435848 [Nemania sp. NC0429]